MKFQSSYQFRENNICPYVCLLLLALLGLPCRSETVLFSLTKWFPLSNVQQVPSSLQCTSPDRAVLLTARRHIQVNDWSGTHPPRPAPSRPLVANNSWLVTQELEEFAFDLVAVAGDWILALDVSEGYLVAYSAPGGGLYAQTQLLYVDTSCGGSTCEFALATDGTSALLSSTGWGGAVLTFALSPQQSWEPAEVIPAPPRCNASRWFGYVLNLYGQYAILNDPICGQGVLFIYQRAPKAASWALLQALDASSAGDVLSLDHNEFGRAFDFADGRLVVADHVRGKANLYRLDEGLGRFVFCSSFAGTLDYLGWLSVKVFEDSVVVSNYLSASFLRITRNLSLVPLWSLDPLPESKRPWYAQEAFAATDVTQNGEWVILSLKDRVYYQDRAALLAAPDAPPDPPPVGMIVGIVVALLAAALLVLAIAFFLLSSNKPFTAGTLPEEIEHVLEEVEKEPHKEGQKLLKRKFKENEKSYTIARKILAALDGEGLPILEVWGVLSHLKDLFLGYVITLEERFSKAEEQFLNRKWTKDPKGLREWTIEKYEELCARFEWNDNRIVKMVPLVHGTSFKIAKSICATGFAALSAMDCGWYGQGIYFSSSARYVTPYFSSKRKPTVIVAVVVPGNPYPVVEGRGEEGSFEGRPIVPGHQCHYVVTGLDGAPVGERRGRVYDELVICQEVQALPVFMVRIDEGRIQELANEFNREIQQKKADLEQNTSDVYIDLTTINKEL